MNTSQSPSALTATNGRCECAVVFLRGVLSAGCLGLMAGCFSEPAPDISSGPPAETTAAVSSKPSEVIARFCGDCHVFPDPDYFPQSAWYKEVQRGFNFYTDSGRQDLVIPSEREVFNWYRQQAPVQLPPPKPLPSGSSPLKFERQPLDAAGTPPLVASLAWTPNTTEWPGLWFSDMGEGRIGFWNPQTQGIEIQANLDNVASTKLGDVDQDGKLDLLICDLGTPAPGDHALGRWLYVPGSNRQLEPIPLLTGVGRVADAAIADFDQDGDQDVAIAEFGWLKTGSIRLLTNIQDAGRRGEPLTEQDFQSTLLDERHGAIHVHVTDLNQDGRLDLLALISQEFETVVAWINTGPLQFRKEVVMSPQDPSFGSCGIELVDLDQDGDQDLLYTNGDTLDSHLVKHYHGVHWLRNDGVFPFQMQRLLTLPGASDTATADFDGDGDLDIAVSGYLPRQLHSQMPTGQFDSLLWLEQTDNHEFQTHVLETGNVGHLGLAAGDFNRDGRIDLATGDSPGTGWGALWWNRGAAN